MTTKKVTKSIKRSIKMSLPPVNFGVTKNTTTVQPLHPRATILYQRMPEGLVLIKGFRGFLTSEELETKYGKEVTAVYFSLPINVEKVVERNGEVAIELFRQGEECGMINKGDVFSGKEFSKVLGSVRKCGELLEQISASVKLNPIREFKM